MFRRAKIALACVIGCGVANAAGAGPLSPADGFQFECSGCFRRFTALCAAPASLRFFPQEGNRARLYCGGATEPDTVVQPILDQCPAPRRWNVCAPGKVTIRCAVPATDTTPTCQR